MTISRLGVEGLLPGLKDVNLTEQLCHCEASAEATRRDVNE